MITNLYWANRYGEEYLRYARVKDPETEEVRLAEPYELLDPEDAEVGDEYAYKVSLLTDPRIFEHETY